MMRAARRARGFSLIELMVAITLGLVLLAGVAQVFLNSKRSYRVQESVGRLQESARFATDYLGRYLRLADFWGGAEASAVRVLGPSTLPAKSGSACRDAWVLDPKAGVSGYPGDDGGGRDLAYPGGGFPTGCLDNYLPGSDVLAIRFADPDTYIDSASLAAGKASSVNGKWYLRTSVGRRAELFDATGANLANAVADIPGAADAGVLNYQFQTVVFYLQTNDFGQGPTPTLAILHLQSSGLSTDPLVDGIEMLKFEYGIDSDADGSVDRYLPAGAVTDWSQVLSVRASLVVRGDALDSHTDAQRYRMSQNYQWTPAQYGAVAGGTRFQRRLVVREIQLRNRVRQ